MPSIAGWLSCGYDAVLVVDESEVRPGGDASRFLLGRLFSADEHREVVRLEQILARAESERWHSTGDVTFFRSPCFGDVVAALRDLPYSTIFDMRVTPSQVAALREKYGRALEEQPELRPTWRAARRATVEEITLFRYLAMVKVVACRYLAQKRLPWRRLLTVCDRQSGLRPGHARVFLPIPTWKYEGEVEVGYEFDALGILGKEHPDTLHAVRAVGLIDAELWAIRRFLAQPMEDGRLLDEHFRDWARRGDPEEQVLTQEVVDRTVARTPNLDEYIERVFMWMHGLGRVVKVSEPA